MWDVGSYYTPLLESFWSWWSFLSTLAIAFCCFAPNHLHRTTQKIKTMKESRRDKLFAQFPLYFAHKNFILCESFYQFSWFVTSHLEFTNEHALMFTSAPQAHLDTQSIITDFSAKYHEWGIWIMRAKFCWNYCSSLQQSSCSHSSQTFEKWGLSKSCWNYCSFFPTALSLLKAGQNLLETSE